MASIASRTSKKARQAARAAILKRRLNEQLQSDMAATVQLNDSLNPAPRQRRRIERYTPPLPPAPPESPFLDSEPAQHACYRAPVEFTSLVLVTQHSQLRTASNKLQTIRVGQQDDPNYAEVHFWTRPTELDFSACADGSQLDDCTSTRALVEGVLSTHAGVQTTILTRRYMEAGGRRIRCFSYYNSTQIETG